MRLGRSASAWSIVADTDNQRVDVLSPELTYLRSTPIPDPLQVAANASSIYVLSPTGYNYTLSQFANDSSLTPEASHVIAGIGDDQLTGPADIYDQLAVNDSGDLLLTDRSDQTILMYDPSLSFLGAWHESTPISGLAIGDYAGGQQLYFAENVYSNADIVRSDIQGHQQGTFGPTTVGGLSLSPWALATDSKAHCLGSCPSPQGSVQVG